VVRMALPAQLLARVVESGGVESGETAGRRFGPAELALHRFVFARLPHRATDVRLAWDGARGEVVASFARRAGAGAGA